MSQYYGAPPPQGGGGGGYAPSSAQNLQFYPSTYGAPPVSGHATPSQASYGYGAGPSSTSASGYGSPGFGSSFGAAPGAGAPGVSGRMGEQGGLRTGWLAALSTEGYDGEPPLLEELGVDFSHVKAKTLAVLNPFSRIDQHLMDDSDLAGPVLFFLLFGTFLLFSGKVQFGYVYGLALLGSISLHTILSLMSPSDLPSHPSQGVPGPSSSSGPSYGGQQPGEQHLSQTLTFARSASVLGYCLLPLVATSLLGIVMPLDTPLGMVIVVLAILWSTYSASGMFIATARMRGMRALVAYPLMLFYVGFGIMGVFSSRGSGAGGLRAAVPLAGGA
ncbi:Yip1 domain-containing protein [Coniochaeta sp. 2T2.1]|nr:Yip1 domain-containing protein [Coniochaeta sp. 2T2.1]